MANIRFHNCALSSYTLTKQNFSLVLVTRCIYEGAEYSPGSEIFRGVDEKKGVCYTLICSIKGKVVTGSRKRCTTTEQPFTTGPRIDGGYQKYSTKKSDLETLQKLNNVTTAVLFPDTTSQPINTVTEQKTKKFLWSEPTTSKEATPRFTEPVGCQVNGKFFPPGAEISEGYDESSDWCYGEYCNQYSEVINWDTWDCKGKFSSTGGREILNVLRFVLFLLHYLSWEHFSNPK